MRVEIRRARSSDKAPLMEFIKDVWGGHDYIPRVWDAWIGDRAAKMFVLTADGKPVGMNRMRYLTDGTAWLEGVRIHPDYRGLGLASALGNRSIEEGKKDGILTYRLTSGSWNRAAHRQVAKMGFKEIARDGVYAAEKGARFATQSGIREATSDDLQDVWQMVSKSREFKLGAGVYWDGFSATGLTRETLAALVEEGHVFMTDGALAIAKLGGEGAGVWRQVCFLTGEPSGAARVVKHVFGKPERAKTTWRLVYVPKGSRLTAALKKIGLKRSWPLVLYEIKASQ